MKALEDWQSITLGEICKFTGGDGFREELQGRKDGDYPFIKVSDMELPDNKKMIIEANNWIDEKTRLKEALKTFPKDSVVFAKVGAALLLNRRRILTRPTCIDNNMMAALPTGIDPLFLFYKLLAIDFADFVQSGAVPSINQGQLLCISFEFPQFIPEQTKIAEILSTVDRAIEQTEALIAKQQRIKTGLIHDLLTRGIDEHDNLRSEQTHEFKDSPLGRIPVEWEVKRLSELVDENITYGIVQAGPNIENGIPYIRTGDMAGETINAAQLLKTLERIAKSYKRSAVFSGDIVFALRATVGKVLPVSKELEGSNLTQGTAKISPNKSIESTFLLWALQTAVVQDQIRLHQKGTTFMEITLADLRSIEVALPIMQDEQSSIAEKLTKHDDLRLQYIKNRQKLHYLKTALMQDLLTGKKRVTPLLKQEASRV